MSSHKDKSLVHRLKAGDGFAFEELYLAYYSKIYHFALQMLRNNSVEAEGVAQEVFASVWEKRESLNEELSFSGYIFKQTKNRVLNIWRHNLNKQKYLEDILPDSADSSDETNQKIELNETLERIKKSIQELPPRRREIFLLSRDNGLSYREIAKQLKISENTVDTQIRQALKFIRERFILLFILFFSC